MNLGQRFSSIAKCCHNKIALKFYNDNSISFVELENFSSKIANWLHHKGLDGGSVVAIQNSKTPLGFAAMLACLKLGIIYTNFDYSNPKERILKIFQCARPALVLSDTEMTAEVVELCGELNISTADYTCPQVQAEINSQSSSLDESLIKEVSPDSPAYIMFTSGSTGVPKGVVIRHLSIIKFIDWAKEVYGLLPDDILTNVNPIYFDNSVFDFYCSIFNGLTMAAFPREITSQPKKMLELIDQAGCTFWFSVPSFLIYLTNIKLLNHNTFKSIRTFAFGGEAYPKKLLKKLFDLYTPRARFFNVYGPTEGTCICSAHEVRADNFDDDDPLVTLGHMAPIFNYLILDGNDTPAEEGELCLMGSQLALYYYNDPERTAKSFVPNPLDATGEQTMYRTGDLVALKGGNLYFRGRSDNQIKHMGYRIELEEIEAGLIQLPYVRQCAVVQMKNETGLSKLVAWLVTDSAKEQKEIRGDLRAILPDYMIPTIFECLAELPTNPNGKIDRVALKKQLLCLLSG